MELKGQGLPGQSTHDDALILNGIERNIQRCSRERSNFWLILNGIESLVRLYQSHLYTLSLILNGIESLSMGASSYTLTFR